MPANPDLRAIQTSLNAMGHDAGSPDGLWGRKTRSGLQSLIDANGQPQRAPYAPPASSGVIKQGSAVVHEIVVHCWATQPDFMAGQSLEAKRDAITSWHKQRGFSTIGYHWIIDRDGRVLPCRPETQVGAHVQGHNTGTIGISLAGGFGSAATDRFDENYTPAQDAALRKLIAEISQRTPITRISGHNEYAAKACPGFNVTNWLKGA